MVTSYCLTLYRLYLYVFILKINSQLSAKKSGNTRLTGRGEDTVHIGPGAGAGLTGLGLEPLITACSLFVLFCVLLVICLFFVCLFNCFLLVVIKKIQI